MITEDFIKGNKNFERNIPIPAKFKKSSWYSTKMRIAKENGGTNIILENFVQRQANEDRYHRPVRPDHTKPTPTREAP